MGRLFGGNMGEQECVNPLGYLQIDKELLRRDLDDEDCERLIELGVSGAVLLLFRQGFIGQLREDIAGKFFEVLNTC